MLWVLCVLMYVVKSLRFIMGFFAHSLYSSFVCIIMLYIVQKIKNIYLAFLFQNAYMQKNPNIGTYLCWFTKTDKFYSKLTAKSNLNKNDAQFTLKNKKTKTLQSKFPLTI